MKKAFIISIISMLAICSACSKEDTIYKCSSDVCNGNKLIVCNDDGTTTTKDCGDAGCDTAKNKCNNSQGQDTSPETGCKETQCSGNALNICDPETGKITVQNCGKAGCNKTTKQCNTFIPDTKCSQTKCDGNNLVICDPDSGNTINMNCGKAGCNTSTNKCNEIAISDRCSKTICNGSKLIVCDIKTGATIETDCGSDGCNEQKLSCNFPADKCEANVCRGNTLIICDTATGNTSEQDCGSDGCNEQTLACNTNASDFVFQEVPAGQDNQKDAKCNPQTFIPHCEGTKIITCEENLITEAYTVMHFDCANPDEGWDDLGDDDWGDDDLGDDDWEDFEYLDTACAVTLIDGKNEPICVNPASDSEDLCSPSENGTQSEYCGHDEYDPTEIKIVYSCQPYSDHTYRWYDLSYTLCSTTCAEGCKQTSCDINKQPVCKDNVAYSCINEDYFSFEEDDEEEDIEGVVSIQICDNLKCVVKDDEGFYGEKYAECE